MNLSAAAQRGQEQRVRHGEEVEPDAGGNAVHQIDKRLHQQLSADAGRRLVKRLCGDGQLAVPDQSNQTVAQIPALEQHEDDRHEHEPGGSQRSEDRTEPRKTRVTLVLFRGDHHGSRRGALGRIWRSQVRLDVFDRFLQFLDRTALAGAAHVLDLRADVLAVHRQILGQVLHLSRHDPARQSQHGEYQRDHHEYGRDAPEPTLEPGGRRRQDECQEDGQREGHEYGVRPVQDEHHQHAPRKRHPGFQARGRVIHRRVGE